MEEQQLFFLGASDHAQLRRTIANALSQRRVAELTERIRKTAETLLDAITPGVPVDLGEAFAWPFPVAALCDLLGIPPADHGLIYDYIFQATHPGTADAPETSVADYLADLIERRRAAPGDDLLSDMCRDESTDTAHSAVLAAARLLIVVGPRPVAHLLTDGLALLLHERDRWETLLAKPHLLNGAVEELLRFVAPASLAFRYGREEVQIAGRSLPQGSRFYCSLLAANRDPARFADPDRFDLERPAGQHLAFGLGYRHCLGAALVRAEIRVALAVLLERFPQIRLATADERFQVGADGGTRGGNMVVILDPSRYAPSWATP
ncbi:cytochrome P450 [Streptomyces werraensis]|uniref:cytochrome P450 n=1 Tax=Streptomyces werraensis TaxID=68284 RepID=UPI001CE29AAD